jgi:hypothetical protein
MMPSPPRCDHGGGKGGFREGGEQYDAPALKEDYERAGPAQFMVPASDGRRCGSKHRRLERGMSLGQTRLPRMIGHPDLEPLPEAAADAYKEPYAVAQRMPLSTGS